MFWNLEQDHELFFWRKREDAMQRKTKSTILADLLDGRTVLAGPAGDLSVPAHTSGLVQDREGRLLRNSLCLEVPT